MQLQLKHRALDLRQPVVMGILNVTPDSFADGGKYRALSAALDRAREMVAQGASIIDIGGESSRPGALPVREPEELDRTLPVIEAIARELDCIISIDTTKPAVMWAACEAGAELINDINALRAPGALAAACDSGAGVCLMHMQQEPRTMQQNPSYGDVVAEVHDFLAQRLQACVEAGIDKNRIALDPGFGFGKRLEHNLALLAQLDAFTPLGCPLLVGLSRKSMLGLAVEQRLSASLAAAALAVWQGAVIVRAHDVRATVEAIKLASAVREYRRHD